MVRTYLGLSVWFAALYARGIGRRTTVMVVSVHDLPLPVNYWV